MLLESLHRGWGSSPVRSAGSVCEDLYQHYGEQYSVSTRFTPMQIFDINAVPETTRVVTNLGDGFGIFPPDISE